MFFEQGVSYTINLLEQGDESVHLTISCPGEEVPASGNHSLGGAESDCSASYRRTVGGPFTTVEQAEAVSGSLVVRDSERKGDLKASATFDALPIAGGD